jgi:hypothetical protein
LKKTPVGGPGPASGDTEKGKGKGHWKQSLNECFFGRKTPLVGEGSGRSRKGLWPVPLTPIRHFHATLGLKLGVDWNRLFASRTMPEAGYGRHKIFRQNPINNPIIL